MLISLKLKLRPAKTLKTLNLACEDQLPADLWVRTCSFSPIKLLKISLNFKFSLNLLKLVLLINVHRTCMNPNLKLSFVDKINNYRIPINVFE